MSTSPHAAARLADPGAAPPPRGGANMPFLAHLGELRRRLIYVLVALTAAGTLSFLAAPMLFEWLRQPLRHVPNSQMVVLGPLEMFVTHIKLAVLAAIFITSPHTLWQVWQFISPGLYRHERRMVAPFVLAGSACFVGGAAFCFYVVLPASFHYLVDMVPVGVEAHYSVALYFSLVIHLMLAFGIVFELPLILTLFGAAGVVTAAGLVKFRKYWLIVAVILGGVLTPTPDPLTQMMMAIPLMLFFEVGIWGVRLVAQKRRAPQAMPQGAR